MSRRPFTLTPCGIYGPRHLARRHAKRVKNRRLAELKGLLLDDAPHLGPGQEELFSFWTPALEANEYTITVGQDITSSSTTEHLNVPKDSGTSVVSQDFDVVAPRYSLPANAVNSNFPPQGAGALPKTLPHIVLADPHLPWARDVSDSPKPADLDYGKNKVPWMALLLFTQDELKLSSKELTSRFQSTSIKDTVVQNQTLGIPLPVSDIPNIQATVSPATGLKPEVSDDAKTSVVLLPSTLFSELVTAYTDQGARPATQVTADVARYKYLAHVRDINTDGMADAGVEPNGVFGIVVSHRTGPLTAKVATPVFAHLVSLEGIEHMSMPLPASASRVAMVTLYSWTFTTLPVGSFDIDTTFVNLGSKGPGMNLLRAPDAVITSVDTTTPFGPRMQSRLNDGYTLTRYRPRTGEVSAALYRGPLTPTIVPYPLSATLQKPGLRSCWLSDSGDDLQILDPQVGIMDITYSVAWQLGKTLAISDRLFTTALGRLRTAIYSKTMDSIRATVWRQHNVYATKAETVRSLVETLPMLNELNKPTGNIDAKTSHMVDRWQRTPTEVPDLSYGSPLIEQHFADHAYRVGQDLMGSPDGHRYDEFNTANSVDWSLVVKWLLDRMYLYSVPAQYLIPDQSFLPAESLRFYNIDQNWIDAMVDGALSVANHVGSPDKVRFTIHQMLEEYLWPSSPSQVAKEGLADPSPLPTYGFLMRSQAVTMYPDLKVDVTCGPEGTDDGLTILRHEILDSAQGVMLCLLRYQPGVAALQSVTFTQPPHQQSFIAGSLTEEKLDISYRKIYTLAGQTPDPEPWTTSTWRNPSWPSQSPAPDPQPTTNVQAVFQWGSNQTDPEIRTLLPLSYANDVNSILFQHGSAGSLYTDPVPRSAMMGMQLNNPIYRLVIERSSAASNQVSTFPLSLGSSVNHFVQGIKDKLPTLDSDLPTRHKSDQHRLRLGDVNMSSSRGHGPPLARPPNFRRVLPPPKSLPPSDEQAVPPSYRYEVYPSDGVAIPRKTLVPLDLIFSIVQQEASGSWNLYSLEVKFQLNTGSTKEACLLTGDAYTGPGPTMLSNERFFVQTHRVPPTPQDKNTYLVCKISPRSTALFATAPVSQDLSFVLPVCYMADLTNAQYGVYIWVTPQYRPDYKGDETTYIDAVKLE